MNIVVTDSGFGGLGIAAGLYESLKSLFFPEPITIIFVNGLPDENYGYNSIADLKLKTNIFNNLLVNINQKLNPDLIVIACNTLSVLLEKTDIYPQIKDNVIDIIEFGTEKVVHCHKSASNALLAILGTQTTIDSEVHRKYFQNSPDIFSNVLTIPCTELVTAVEDDSESNTTKSIIHRCLKEIETILSQGDYSKLFLILACTHFPYVEHIFRHYLKKSNVPYEIINPNYFMIESIKSTVKDHFMVFSDTQEKVNISVISKTIITDQKIRSIASLIQNISEETIKALQDYRHIPDFFQTGIVSNTKNNCNDPSN
ncbi:aspartate/glutamate racemase family protein [bacterium]|nr:aspartate/glutamate racemase family protein [bacterium]MBU1064716.1 aspartate/glutamate racemase family protein [bacterium]MBU1635461.1 aspartate/glutamate racemase family protein [bacterium]MBU1874937.1 aspartate/glutamate racemase family protein [bacterium]